MPLLGEIPLSMLRFFKVIGHRYTIVFSILNGELWKFDAEVFFFWKWKLFENLYKMGHFLEWFKNPSIFKCSLTIKFIPKYLSFPIRKVNTHNNNFKNTLSKSSYIVFLCYLGQGVVPIELFLFINNSFYIVKHYSGSNVGNKCFNT